MRNLSPLFFRGKNNFLKNISLSEEQNQLMRDTVSKIKISLNEAISKEYGMHPRFMTQGSAGYKTQNTPCYSSQEVDYDIGCYLPFSEIQDTGKPKTAANIYYTTVDNALQKLAEENHWKGINTKKQTCSRVCINSQLHIDIPLYSVPDDEFSSIHEHATESFSKSFCAADSKFDETESWDDFNFKKVLLGRRNGDWQESDPRKINMYFADVFEKKGEQLRRLCRYLKAWRDFKWENGGPKSIYLMCLADDLFQYENDVGDDIALLDLISKIPNRLENGEPVKNKAENEPLPIDESDCKLLKEYAKGFSEDLSIAITNEMITDEEACKLLRKHLGTRFSLESPLIHERERLREYVKSTPINETSTSRPLTRTRAG